MRFWDASALIPLAIEEPFTDTVDSLLREDPKLTIWWGTPLEWTSALERLARERTPPNRLDRARRILRNLHRTASEIQPLDDVRARAIRLLHLHALRAADAFQLSAALRWCREQPEGFEFVCLDHRLRDAAFREGFTVLPNEL